MNRVQNPFSTGIRKPNPTPQPSDIYQHLVNSTGESSLFNIGETLKTKMPESAKDYALYITLLNAL